jgi:hypothetical protein
MVISNKYLCGIVPPGAKRYDETFYPARGQIGIMKHLCRQGPNSKRHVTPPGSGYYENRP